MSSQTIDANAAGPGFRPAIKRHRAAAIIAASLSLALVAYIAVSAILSVLLMAPTTEDLEQRNARAHARLETLSPR